MLPALLLLLASAPSAFEGESLSGRFGQTVVETHVRSTPDFVLGAIISTLPAGAPVTLGEAVDIPISEPSLVQGTTNWQSIILGTGSAYVLREHLELRPGYDPAMFPLDGPDAVPGQALVVEPTDCHETPGLGDPIRGKLAAGSTVELRRRVYLQRAVWEDERTLRPGYDVYLARCGGADSYVKGTGLALLGAEALHEFDRKMVVISNPAGLGSIDWGRGYGRAQDLWLLNRSGTRPTATRIDCRGCYEFGASPTKKWLWACGRFYTARGTLHCTPEPLLGKPAWLDEGTVLLRAADDASVHLVDVKRCREARVIDLTHIPMQDHGDGCVDPPWPAVHIDRTAGRVEFDLSWEDAEVRVSSAVPLAPILSRFAR